MMLTGEDQNSYPSKPVRIGARTFDITGVSADDPYFTGIGDQHDPEFERLCDDLMHSDYICADVGANIGMTTLLLSQYVPRGQVLAVEPGPVVSSLLMRNVARSGCSNIIVVNSAVGDCDGTVKFSENSAYGHISEAGIEVPIHTLSSLVSEHRLPRLDFVKIDVEGHEFPILRSSVDLFNHHQTLVLLEFNTWTLMGLADQNPRRFAEWIFANFTSVYVVRRGKGANYLEHYPADGALPFLHTNLVHDGVVTDLLVTNFAGRLAVSPHRSRTERDAALLERDAALAALAAAVAERDAATAARDAALVDRDALLRSTAWAITAPLRAVSSRIISRLTHRGR